MTPEGKVKARIKKVLDAYKDTHGHIWWFMPVQNGMGAAVVDYIGWVRGRAFAIEAKEDGKHPTPRQEGTLAEMASAGAQTFVVDGGKNYPIERLIEWLNGLPRE